MNINCNGDTLIKKNLIVNIDVNNEMSWDLNTGYTVNSLVKWVDGFSDEKTIYDYGLTAFDIGQTNEMYGNLELESQDNRLKLSRVGFNEVINPTSGETSGYTSTISYDGFGITAATTNTGTTNGGGVRYLQLNGGYLVGFFKLKDFDYNILPFRYNQGITIETVLHLNENSHGIFYMMGARAEDKYIPHFSGETTIKNNDPEGVYTSNGEYLHSLILDEVNRPAFKDYQDLKTTEWRVVDNSENINGNVIAFGITEEKRLFYKYINDYGQIMYGESLYTNIVSETGLTSISITYKSEIEIHDSDLYECYKRRVGELAFYVNGRKRWVVNNFPEFYFKAFKNNKTKQIGVPYSISWGGGSFGLKHSYHYDKIERFLFINDTNEYILDNFEVIS